MLRNYSSILVQFVNYCLIHLKGMLLTREASSSTAFFVSCKGLIHLFSYLCKLLYKFRLHICIHGKHILIYEHLSVAVCSRSDTNCRYTYALMCIFLQVALAHTRAPLQMLLPPRLRGPRQGASVLLLHPCPAP